MQDCLSCDIIDINKDEKLTVIDVDRHITELLKRYDSFSDLSSIITMQALFVLEENMPSYIFICLHVFKFYSHRETVNNGFQVGARCSFVVECLFMVW